MKNQTVKAITLAALIALSTSAMALDSASCKQLNQDLGFDLQAVHTAIHGYEYSPKANNRNEEVDAYNLFYTHLAEAKRLTRLEARRGADSELFGCIQLIKEKEIKGASLRGKIATQEAGEEGLTDTAQ
ncbi:MAG: hypothetical protein Q8O24_03105 [Gallionellaceae bacterium]|nr:hypothetical protein [Gallionellaceae bacterium]